MDYRYSETTDSAGNKTVYYWDENYTFPARTIVYDRDEKIIWDSEPVAQLIDKQIDTPPDIARAINTNLLDLL